MRHLNTGEFKLFNIKTDYREEHDLSGIMPDKVAQMDSVRYKYVEAVDGGRIGQVRLALYDLMDEFSRRSREGYAKQLARLKEEAPVDFEKQKADLLRELNDKLLKNEINKEKCRRFASFDSWRESTSKLDVEQAVRSRWVDVTE